jgi:hypothetical protein
MPIRSWAFAVGEAMLQLRAHTNNTAIPKKNRVANEPL